MNRFALVTLSTVLLGSSALSWSQSASTPSLTITDKAQIAELSTLDGSLLAFTEALGNCTKGDVGRIPSCRCATRNSLENLQRYFDDISARHPQWKDSQVNWQASGKPNPTVISFVNLGKQLDQMKQELRRSTCP